MVVILGKVVFIVVDLVTSRSCLKHLPGLLAPARRTRS